jgi:hypothetical protein
MLQVIALLSGIFVMKVARKKAGRFERTRKNTDRPESI